MPKRITQIPVHDSGRSPTGAMQYRDNWPGRFLRGDKASSLASNPSRFLGISASLVVFLTACSVQGQSNLIDASTRNGSFENGVSSPWGGVDTVSMDAGFASDGEWFGKVFSTGRTSSWQNLSVDPLQGREFVVRFDARIGAPGFDTVSTYINAWNADGTYVAPAVSIVSAPPLRINAWGHYERRFVFPSNMDGARLRVGLDMSGGDFISTHVGYFDNIVVEQIPEPGPSLLVLAACGLAISCWIVTGMHNQGADFGITHAA